MSYFYDITGHRKQILESRVKKIVHPFGLGPDRDIQIEYRIVTGFGEKNRI